MSLKSFREKIDESKKVIKIAEDAAAATTALTAQAKNAGAIMPKETTFTFPTEGVMLAQVQTELKHFASPGVKFVDNGATASITTNNPRAVISVLKKFGIPCTIEGEVLSSVHTDNRTAA